MNNTEKIWNKLILAGLTPAGAAGLMGNLYAESGMIPNRVEILCLKRLKEVGKLYTDATYTAFVDNGTITRKEFLNPLPKKQYGYGLAQWTTPTRKGKLYDYARIKGTSIGDLSMQVDFLIEELKTSFKSVYNTLTTTGDIKEASDAVLKKFESPADTGSAVQTERAKYATSYYSTYHIVTADTIIDIFKSWIGKNEYDGSHRVIIDTYNSWKPLARGYKVKYTDAWCDSTVSAAFIKANAVSLIGGTECGVAEHVIIFKKAGIWKGKVKPKRGDIIVFDWQTDGLEDHIGIVESVEGNIVTTIEGNYRDAVSRRVIAYNDKQIAGYARPKYGTKQAEKKDNEVTAKHTADLFDKSLAGTYICTANVNMRHGAGSAKNAVITTIPKGTKVRCYGYYSLNGSAKWLYVQVTIDKVKYTGFCVKGYLKKQ